MISFFTSARKVWYDWQGSSVTMGRAIRETPWVNHLYSFSHARRLCAKTVHKLLLKYRNHNYLYNRYQEKYSVNISLPGIGNYRVEISHIAHYFYIWMKFHKIHFIAVLCCNFCENIKLNTVITKMNESSLMHLKRSNFFLSIHTDVSNVSCFLRRISSIAEW